MLGFLVRRLAWAVVLFLVVTLYTYILFFVVPYKQINVGARGSDQNEASSVGESLGLEGGVIREYLGFLSHAVRGDFGESWTSRRDVSEMILTAAPATGSLVLGGAVIWMLLAFPIGILSALRPRSLLDRAGMVFVLIGISAHPLWIGYILSWAFGFKLGIMPINGYCDLFDATGPCGGPAQWAWHLFLPWVTFALGFAAIYARMIRASVIETLGEDYVRTARAKGLGEGAVIRHHALRNALMPVVTMIGMDVAALWFASAVFVERVFGLPGIGNLLYGALLRRDLPVIVGVVVLVTTVILVFNLFVDLLYGVIDPRVQTVQGTKRVRRRSLSRVDGGGKVAPAAQGYR